jgi:hypothetical protein
VSLRIPCIDMTSRRFHIIFDGDFSAATAFCRTWYLTCARFAHGDWSVGEMILVFGE